MWTDLQYSSLSRYLQEKEFVTTVSLNLSNACLVYKPQFSLTCCWQLCRAEMCWPESRNKVPSLFRNWGRETFGNQDDCVSLCMWYLRVLTNTCSFVSTETMMGTPPPASELQQSQPQALHYALANAQQVQIHQIGEDGQVQVVRIFSLRCLGRWGEGLRGCWWHRGRKHTDSLRWKRFI